MNERADNPHAMIGHKLKSLYCGVEKEAVPERMSELLERLHEKHGFGMGRGNG